MLPFRGALLCLGIFTTAVIISLTNKNSQFCPNLRYSGCDDYGRMLNFESGDRPIIYTFYNSIYVSFTGVPQDKMFRVWHESWAEAGWNPVILTIRDAEKHPRFSEMNSIFDAKNYHPNKRLCYYRYLAMATIPGGGWFSEHHVLPLRPTLKDPPDMPNNGAFTIFDRHVPSLVSGNRTEWDRISFSIMEKLRENDLLSLLEIHDISPDAYHMEKKVLHTNLIFSSDQFTSGLCATTKDMRAIRFSLNDINQANFNEENRPSMAKSWMKVWKARCRSGRPVIHTFFEQIDSRSTSGSAALVQAWKEAWYNAGWEPLVLNMDDVKRHPDYSKIMKLYDPEDKEYHMSIYDRFCFLRWFAMASSGGGWMSDIDAFPLHTRPEEDGIFLPNDGKLTGYERFIPCLVSGTSIEWNRMANLITSNYLKHTHEFWSDMLALKELHDTENAFIYRKESIPFHFLFNKNETLSDPYELRSALTDRCELTKDKRVVHFSHYSVWQGIEGIGFSAEDYKNQERIARKWTNAWRNQCLNNHEFFSIV